MSKSRNHKWFDHDDENTEHARKKKKYEDRRRNKRQKQALKTRDLETLQRMEEDA